ncbi:hypothetical protein P1S61_40355 [Streptomyces sp. ME08-AFT2]|nr:hypothetical protein [Streptomyces sp. ME08-AFT2]
MAGRRARLRLAYSAGRRTARLRCTRTFGLTAAELRAEMRRLTSRGWQLWEVAYRFGCDCKDTA